MSKYIPGKLNIKITILIICGLLAFVFEAKAWGNNNYALDFIAENTDSVVVADADILDLDDGNGVTIECWLNIDSNVSGGIVSKPLYESTHTLPFFCWGLIYNTDGKIRFRFDSAMNVVTDSGAINPDSWHHVAGVTRNDSAFIYIDGVQAYGDTSSLMVPDSARSTDVDFGFITDGRSSLDGSLAEVRLYIRGLDSSEVVYNCENPCRLPGDPEDSLVGRWSFREGAGKIAYDLSGFGNNGTIEGADWISGIGSCSGRRGRLKKISGGNTR